MERIVVGVDGSTNSRAALRFAIEEAQRRGARVDAVMVWHRPYATSVDVWVPAMHFDTEAIESGYRERLADLIESADPPDGVVVEPVLVEGSASSGLLDASKGATMVVVGRRGHGGFRGLLLGSVSNQVAVHATCPVVVVPAPSEDG